MERQRISRMVREVLDSLPEEFRMRLHNVAVLVEDLHHKPLRGNGPASQQRGHIPNVSYWACFMACR